MKHRKHLIALLLLLVLGESLSARPRETGTFRFIERRGPHTAAVVFQTRNFKRSAHTLTFADQRYLKEHSIVAAEGAAPMLLKIDGRQAHGTDGYLPRVEIQSMSFWIDGKRLVVPKRLYSDCFGPNLDENYLAINLQETGEALMVFMEGGDAAGSYQVVWVLRRDGHHSRFISDCSDCDTTGFRLSFEDEPVPPARTGRPPGH